MTEASIRDNSAMMRTYLAFQRTIMAYVRTIVAIVGLDVILFKVYEDSSSPLLYLFIIGTAPVLFFILYKMAMTIGMNTHLKKKMKRKGAWYDQELARFG